MRAEIVVELPLIRHNVQVLTEHTGVAMMTVVKADGYGHGMVPVARAAREAGAAWLGVATIDEALALRAAGDTGRVLSWLGVPGEDYAAAIAADVDVTAYTVAELDEVAAGVRRAGRPGRLQLKVDTGLSRGGAALETWPDVVAAARAGEERGDWTVTGVWSHFACSDEPDHPANDAQEQAFRAALATAERAGLRPEVRHLANSAAAILRPSSRFDLVRCGLASYGLDPAPGHTPGLGLVPAMSVLRRAGPGQADRRRGRRLLRPHLARRAVDDRRRRPGRVRRRRTPPRRQPRRGPGRRPPPAGARADLHGPVRGRPRRRPGRPR